MPNKTCKDRIPAKRFNLIMFIGLPGAGKSTQASLLHALLRSRGYKTLFVDVGYTGLFMRPLWILCDKLWRHVVNPPIQDYKQELFAEKIVRSFKQRIKVLFVLASVLNLIMQLLFANLLRLCNYVLLAEGYIVDTILCTLYENVVLNVCPGLRRLFHRIAFKVLLNVSNYSVIVILDYSPMLVDTRRRIVDNPYRFQIHYLKRYRKVYTKLLHNLTFMRMVIIRTDRTSITETFRLIARHILKQIVL